MSWLLWRQHRRQGAFTLALLGVFGVLLWVTGISMSHTYHVALSNCAATDSCDDLRLFEGWSALFNLVNFTVLAPALIGVFWGATIVGRELDTGTNRLVWTQSVTRRQWLRSKIALLLISSVAVGAALAGVVTWWSGTTNSLNHDRFGGIKFDIQGVSPIGYTLFAATLGLACGVLWRRTLPAIATTVGVFFAVRLIVEGYLRPHYMTPVTTTLPLGSGKGGPLGSWVLTSSIELHGQAITGKIQLSQSCEGVRTRAESASCLAKAGYMEVTKYQPAGRYWNFQLIELVIFVGLAALMTAVAVVALSRQDA